MSLICLPLVNSSLAPSRNYRIHGLNWIGVDGVVGGSSLERLAAINRLRGDLGHELGTMGFSVSASGWQPLQGAVPRLSA